MLFEDIYNRQKEHGEIIFLSSHLALEKSDYFYFI